MSITLMKEETLSSFAVRSLYVSGVIDKQDISRPLLSPTSSEWIIFPKANEELIKIYAKVFETRSVISVIRNHTLAPIYKPTSTDLELFLETSLTIDEKFYNFLKARARALNKREILKARIQFCPMCFMEQVSACGFTWFKREWLIDRISGCLKHGCALITNCQCGRKPKRIDELVMLMQNQCSHCDASPWIVRRCEAKQDYSLWLSNLLIANLKSFSTGLIVNMLYDAAYILKRRLNANDLSICGILASLFDPLLLDSSISHGYAPDSDMVRNYRYRFSRALFYESRVSHDLLFYPLSLCYPNFNDFLSFIDDLNYYTVDDGTAQADILDPDLWYSTRPKNYSDIYLILDSNTTTIPAPLTHKRFIC